MQERDKPHISNFNQWFGKSICECHSSAYSEWEHPFNKMGGQKDLSEKRIATDLYYYYGEIECKINACFKLHVSYIYKGIPKSIHSYC